MSVSTPVAWAWRKLRPSDASGTDARLEQSPAPALFLHWLFTMLLIAATSSLAPAVAYQVLVSIYCYTVVLMFGLFVAGGLLYLRWAKREEWTDSVGFRPPGGPTAAIVYRYVNSDSESANADLEPLVPRACSSWSQHSYRLRPSHNSTSQIEVTVGMLCQLWVFPVL